MIREKLQVHFGVFKWTGKFIDFVTFITHYALCPNETFLSTASQRKLN